jgi:lysozyme
MQINQKGLDLIKSFEGCKLTSYLCPAKVWTIGFGHTGDDVKPNMNISLARAEELLKQDLIKFEQGVQKIVTSTLNENQFSALVSFAYNCGLSNLNKSTLLKRVNANPSDATIRDAFAMWNKAGGVVLAGLTKRRSAEALLYNM